MNNKPKVSPSQSFLSILHTHHQFGDSIANVESLKEYNFQIIIMQRRKIISTLKSKPRLVLDREHFNSTHTQMQEDPYPISIIKILDNKQNHKSTNKQLQTRSLDKIQRQGSLKRTNFCIRPLKPIKNDPSEHNQPLNLPSSFPATQPSKMTNLTLNQFLEQLTHKMKISPQVFHFSGDLTLSSTLFTRIIRTIIEEIGSSAASLQNVCQKVSAVIVGGEDEAGGASKKDIMTESKNKLQALAFSKQVQFNYYPLLLAKTTKSIDLPLAHKDTLAQQELVGSSNSDSAQSFVFSHLCQLQDYIMHQPNKILHEAVRRHKYLEQELFAYADLLSISRMGANTYTPEVNICAMEAVLDREMRELNRQLVQGESSLEQKGRMLRDYVLRVRQGYAGVVSELMSVIDRKTEQAKIFVDKVLKWEENYLVRKEYLGNLKKEYCSQLQALTTAMTKLSEGQRVSAVLGTLEENVAAIHRIFLLGNSFY